MARIGRRNTVLLIVGCLAVVSVLRLRNTDLDAGWSVRENRPIESGERTVSTGKEQEERMVYTRKDHEGRTKRTEEDDWLLQLINQSQVKDQNEAQIVSSTVPSLSSRTAIPCDRDWHKHGSSTVDSKGNRQAALKAYQPLLVLFTSVKNAPDRNVTHSNTIVNWAQYKPEIAPVLFNDSTDPFLLNLAKRHGWTILPLHPKKEKEAPRLEYMFEAARKAFPESLFVGFSNADILFDEGLLETVRFVGTSISQLNRTLIIGARYNVQLKDRRIVTSTDVRNTILKEMTPELVPICIDYFIIARNQFPWQRFPDNLVIGRPAYDNYMVGLARHDNMTVVDASCTVGALHQIGKDGTKSGSHNKDSTYNIDILKGFNKATGKINKAAFFTVPARDNRDIVLNKHHQEIYKLKDTDFPL